MKSVIAERSDRMARADLDSAAAWIDQLLEPPSDAQWLLLEAGGEDSQEHDVEAQLAIGNGAFGMRASLEQPILAARPGAFIAGLFDTSACDLTPQGR
jgi:hypothetical protein